MEAVTLNAFDRPPVLRNDLAAPTPAPNEVLVRVHASSVSPADNSIAAGMLKQIGVKCEFPVILGRDHGADRRRGRRRRHSRRAARRPPGATIAPAQPAVPFSRLAAAAGFDVRAPSKTEASTPFRRGRAPRSGVRRSW
jgi:hypothetical protein